MLVARDVLGDVDAGAFGVAHLAEDASARAGDAFMASSDPLGLNSMQFEGAPHS